MHAALRPDKAIMLGEKNANVALSSILRVPLAGDWVNCLIGEN